MVVWQSQYYCFKIYLQHGSKAVQTFMINFYGVLKIASIISWYKTTPLWGLKLTISGNIVGFLELNGPFQHDFARLGDQWKLGITGSPWRGECGRKLLNKLVLIHYVSDFSLERQDTHWWWWSLRRTSFLYFFFK